MTTTLTDFQNALQARLDRLTTDVAGQTELAASIKTLLAGNSTQMAELKAEVAALTAQGVDASVLQPLLDKFDAVNAANEAAQADLSAAVVANTPAAAPAPAADPAPVTTAQGDGAGV